MSAFERLVEKFLFHPDRVEPSDVLRLVEALGYRPHKKGGSENTFHKRGRPPLNVPTVSGRRIKPFYVKRLVTILELEEWYESHKQP